jgi:NAD-dependent dihydropyrimidine dehydrogenase PreA subunit
MSKATVLVCRCANTDFVPRADVDGLVGRLKQAGCDVTAVDDLCGLVARRDPRLKAMVGPGGPQTIVACFPRTVRSLFAAVDAELPADATILNLRTQSVDEILDAIKRHACEEASGLPSDGATANLAGETKNQSEIQNEGGPKSEISDTWLPWFPVIDYSRCKHCRQCANFCLFGVYAIDEGKDAKVKLKVKVARPASCKPLCPACARLCPHAAIIFPKYGSAPINGDAVTAENIGREHVGEELLKSPEATGGLLEILRQRAKRAHQPAADTAPASDPKSETALPSAAQRILDSARRRAEKDSNPADSNPRHKA